MAGTALLHQGPLGPEQHSLDLTHTRRQVLTAVSVKRHNCCKYPLPFTDLPRVCGLSGALAHLESTALQQAENATSSFWIALQTFSDSSTLYLIWAQQCWEQKGRAWVCRFQWWRQSTERDDKAKWQRAYLDVIVPGFSLQHFNRSHKNKPKPSTNLTKYSTFFFG